MIAMGTFSALWLGWASLLAFGFAVLESIALHGKHRDPATLSKNIQWLVDRHKWILWTTLFAWGAFATWFAAHIYGQLI